MQQFDFRVAWQLEVPASSSPLPMYSQKCDVVDMETR